MADEPKLSWWQHPVRIWFRDSLFWREIIANVFSAIIVSAILYGLALGLGYVRTPSGRRIALSIWLLTDLIFIGALVTINLNRMIQGRNPRPHPVRLIVLIIAFVWIAASGYIVIK
jgi:hypothetical protein